MHVPVHVVRVPLGRSTSRVLLHVFANIAVGMEASAGEIERLVDGKTESSFVPVTT